MIQFLLILCFFATGLFAQSQISLPSSTQYFNFDNTPVKVIRGVSAIEFDSLKSELKVYRYKGKSVEFFSVVRNNQTWWVRASTVRKLYVAQEPRTGGYDNNSSSYESTATQCKGVTRSGKRCKRMTNSNSGKCFQHE